MVWGAGRKQSSIGFVNGKSETSNVGDTAGVSMCVEDVAAICGMILWY